MSKTISIGDEFAFVDDEDYDRLSQWSWSKVAGYAARSTNGKDIVFMHMDVLGIKDGCEIDHHNMNKLDNRKSNLRHATRSENSANKQKYRGEYTSEYKGVTWHKRSNKWLVQIMKDYKYIYLGLYSDEVAAANCYNYYANLYFGEFAHLNECPPMQDWETYRDGSSSRYYGVTWHKQRNMWMANLRNKFTKKSEYLGYFHNEEEAAIAYNRRAVELYGDGYSKLNQVTSAS